MDNITETENMPKQKPFKRIVFFIVLLLILFPVVFLILKRKPKDAEPMLQNAATPATTADIANMERVFHKTPSYDNAINLALLYINNKLAGKSIPILKLALNINPRSSIAYNDLGVAYTMQQQYQNGIDACNHALTLDPNFQLAKNNLKWATDVKNKVIDNIKQQELTDANKRNAPFYIDYGFNFYKLGDYTRAIDIWNKVFDTEPKNTIALNNIGSAFVMKMQYDDAIAMFNQTLKFDPNNQLAKNNIAWALDEKARSASLFKK